MFDGSSRLLLPLLRLATLVKVLDDDSDEHVQDEEADQQEERDEVEQTPLAVVQLRLNTIITGIASVQQTEHLLLPDL